MLKIVPLLILLFSLSYSGFSQSDSVGKRRDTPQVLARQQRDTPLVKPMPRQQNVTQPGAPAETRQTPGANRRQVADSIAPRQTTIVPAAPNQAAQNTAVPPVDTLPPTAPDTLVQAVLPQYTGIDSAYARFLNNPYLPITRQPVYQIAKLRQATDKDQLFYLVAGLVFYLACIKLVFSRFYLDVFRLLFQPSFRQKQTREQLQQNNLPSLLMNIFFVLAGGLYITLLAHYYQFTHLPFWKLFGYCTAGLGVLYFGKFIFLVFSGWVFNVREAVSHYVFSVFLVNKILGVLLLPFILLVAFSTPAIKDVAITVSILLASLLFLYRYVISFGPVSREIQVSPFHFIIYILSFEVLPLLFIYKSLIVYLSITH